MTRHQRARELLFEHAVRFSKNPDNETFKRALCKAAMNYARQTTLKLRQERRFYAT